MSLENLAIKTRESDTIISELERDSAKAYVSQTGEWVLVFPVFREDVFDIAQKYSSQFNTLAISGGTYDSDDLFLKVFDRGDVILDYALDEGEVHFNKGEVSDLRKYAVNPDDQSAWEKIKEILETDYLDEYAFTEDRYREIINYLGLPPALGDWSFDYIDRTKTEEIASELPSLVKTF